MKREKFKRLNELFDTWDYKEYKEALEIIDFLHSKEIDLGEYLDIFERLGVRFIEKDVEEHCK